MLRRYRENLAAVLPLGFILGFWIALAENFRVVLDSPKLLINTEDLALVFVYGFLVTSMLIAATAIIVSIIISTIDFKNRLKVAAHAGLVACSLAIPNIIAAGSQLINAAAGPYDPSSFAWPLYSMGIVIISILIGIALHSLVNRTYKPNSWHTALGGHFSITTSLGIFLLGV